MNEGCVIFVYYYIMNILYEKGLIIDGLYFEFIYSYFSVVF